MMMEQELPLLVVATRNAHKTGETIIYLLHWL